MFIQISYLFGFLFSGCSFLMLEMDQQVERQKRSKEMKRKSSSKVNKRNKLMTCCRCPCRAASCMFRGIGRCMFVTCYPVVQCLGLDEHRHRHHHHHGKHFDWWHQPKRDLEGWINGSQFSLWFFYISSDDIVIILVDSFTSFFTLWIKNLEFWKNCSKVLLFSNFQFSHFFWL